MRSLFGSAGVGAEKGSRRNPLHFSLGLLRLSGWEKKGMRSLFGSAGVGAEKGSGAEKG